MSGMQGTYSVIVASYSRSGIQWTYSIPRPLVASYDMPGIQWTYMISWALAHSRLIRRARVNVDLYIPPGTPVSSTRKLISSSFHRLDMTLAVAEALNPNKPNLQWVYSIPGP